jgi:RNA polymerase sigma factor (sigma-70 family)
MCEAIRNRIRDLLRRASRRPGTRTLPPDAPASDPSPLEAAVGQELLQRYESALTTLSESDRDLIVAKVELGLSYPEIVEALGKPSRIAARVAVSRAMLRLAREMALDRPS